MDFASKRWIPQQKLTANGEDFAKESFIRGTLLSKILTVCAGLKLKLLCNGRIKSEDSTSEGQITEKISYTSPKNLQVYKNLKNLFTSGLVLSER